MRSIAARDVDLLQRSALALHSHRDIESFRRAVPGIFLDAIPADYFSMQDARVDFKKRTARVLNIWESRPLRAGVRIRPTEGTLFEHPFMKHAMKHGLGGALRLSDFLTMPELRRTALYREVMQPLGFGRVLSIGALGHLGLATLTFMRGEIAPDFTERDRHMLELLHPHFLQARSNLERETHLRANRSTSLAACGLTPRETEVALWLAQGKTNSEIGIILGAPVRTVEKHVERILRKMGAENRASAALAVAEIVRA